MVSVVLLQPFDAIAGSQRVAVNVAQALEASGCRTEVHLGFGSDGFVSRLPGVRRFLDINRIAWRKLLYPVWLLAVVPRVLRAVGRGELVWANTVHAAPAAFVALVLAPRRVVIHVHEVDFPAVFMRFLRFAGRRGATLLCVSDFQRRALCLQAARILPNSVSVTVEGAGAAQRPFLVFVGNTSVAKGFPLFIEVARRLSGTPLVPVAFLPSPERADPDLLARARAAGISVRFGVTDPATMYDGAFLSLLCTDPTLWTETFSLVAVESISCLVPVASGGAGVAREILADALAFDVPSRDPGHIADAVRALLAEPARHQALVQACRRRRGEFTPERFRQRVGALVAELSDGNTE
jgi:glycosyltransferase involved in cell wall biosynthesis